MQEPGVERIVAGHALDLSGIQQKATARLRDIGKADTGKTGDVLAGILAVHAVLERNRLRPDGSAVIAHDPKDAFHQRPFAVTGSLAVEEEHTLETGIAADGVAEGLLQELGLFRIAAHDFADKAVVAVAPRMRVIFRRRDFRKPVLGTVAPELHRAEVQRTVGAVEQETVAVELLHGDRIYALGIGEDRDSHMAALPFPAEIDVAFALMLIVDIQRIPHERIGQSLTQLHRLQRAGVGDPACAVIDVPLLSLRDETSDGLEHVSEQSAVADVVPRIAVILRRME